jgi:hypothetical protein
MNGVCGICVGKWLEGREDGGAEDLDGYVVREGVNGVRF